MTFPDAHSPLITPVLLRQLWRKRGLCPPESATYSHPSVEALAKRMRAAIKELESIERELEAINKSSPPFVY